MNLGRMPRHWACILFASLFCTYGCGGGGGAGPGGTDGGITGSTDAGGGGGGSNGGGDAGNQPGQGVLAGAKPFTGPSPAPMPVTYTDDSGQSRTVLASPGQTFMIVDPAILAEPEVADLARRSGASLLAEIPVAGEYWLAVPTGGEAAFLSSVTGSRGVLFAAPDLPIAVSDAVDLTGATSLTPISLDNAAIAQFDSFRGADHCGSHGDEVQSFLAENGLTVAEYGIGSEATDPLFGLARVAAGGAAGGSRLVVNMSLQSLAEPNDEVDRSGCEMDMSLPPCTSGICGSGMPCAGNYASWKQAQFGFMSQVAALVEHMDPSVRDNTLIVLSAGNSGMDLQSEVRKLRETYGDAMSHILIVGSSNAPANEGHNFSSAAGDMLYANGFGVPVPGQADCTVDGTSFAAPQVANLAARLASQFPDLTTAELLAAIMQAAGPPVDGKLMMPSFEAAAQAAAQSRADSGPRDAGPADAAAVDATTTDASSGDGSSPREGGAADNTCCACNFDVNCTAFGQGGCWRCQNSAYDSTGACPAPQTSLTSPGPCMCDPGLYELCP